MSTLTVLPVDGMHTYVIHHRTSTEVITRTERGIGQSDALVRSRLGSGVVHSADRPVGECGLCRRALAAEAVSR